MSKDIPCPRCNRGVIRCPKCDGDGEIPIKDGFPQILVDLGEAMGGSNNRETCTHCNGSGEVTCAKCGGNGVIEVDDDDDDDDEY